MKRFISSPPARAFMLIALLIVVAIIAILAAIAVPNFLDAQVRSKVSRVRNDERTLATAMESYSVDNNSHYPPERMDIVYTVPEPVRVMAAESHLTTPVAYIASIPLDPFKPVFRYEPPVYWYYNWLERYGELLNWNEWNAGTCPWYGEPAAWLLVSLGPDQQASATIPYDSTNGTASVGDIDRLGPGGGGAK